jgi:hypothetical protein
MKREPNLDHLTTLLGQCLGRIDERAFQIQQLGDDDQDDDLADVLENEAATLQELVGSLVDRCQTPEHCDLNRIVATAADACVQELGARIVVRQRLATDLPQIACTPSQLAYAVQRAMVIAAGRLDVGGELLVTTRRDDDGIVLELESRGGKRDRHLRQRAETLCEFVAGIKGNCRIDLDDRENLFVVLELPQTLVVEDR